MQTMGKVLNAIKKGEIILIYDDDGREGETDIVIGSQFINQDHIRLMRKDGGGLICIAIHPNIAKGLGIPFLVDILEHSSGRYNVLNDLKADDIPYDEKSSFSITVNYRGTFTGITDKDRALTIRELAKVGKEVITSGSNTKFGLNFRSPGHVSLLRAAEGLLENRQGHTELSVELMERSGIIPMATICEMLGDNGNSLSKDQALAYAEEKGYMFIEGREIIKKIKKNGRI